MRQLFSNNAETVLAAQLSLGATSMSASDASGFRTPASGEYEALTLAALGQYEVVHVTARSGNSLTITRGHDGTSDQTWPAGTRVFAGVTAGSLARLLQNESSISTGLAVNGAAADSAHGVAIGIDSSAGLRGVSVGYDVLANGQEAVGAGYFAFADKAQCVALGPFAEADADHAVAIGSGAWAYGSDSISMGILAHALESGSVAIGPASRSRATNAIALGANAEVPTSTGEGSVAIGATAARVANVMHVNALQSVRREAYANTTAGYRTTSAASVILSNNANLAATGVHEITVPAGVVFYPEEVGILVVAANTVTAQPTVQFGVDGAVDQYLAAVETTGLAAVRDRVRWTTLASAKGAHTLRAEVTVAGAATTLTGRFYWRGFALVHPTTGWA